MGSTFWFKVPLAVGKRADLSAQRVVADVAVPLSGLRILSVDDSFVNLKVLERILTREGAVATSCSSGEEAIALLRQQPEAFDLVLMDVQMPGMNGHEATIQIYQSLQLELPVIALTGGVTTLEKERAVASGMKDFLSKPIDPAQLVATVLQWTQPASAQSKVPSCSVAVVKDAADIPGIDRAEAKQILGDDADFLAEMLAVFAAENGTTAGALQQQLQQNDTAAAARLMHKVRGQAASIGALALRDVAAELEAELLRGQVDEVKIERFNEQLRLLCPASD